MRFLQLIVKTAFCLLFAVSISISAPSIITYQGNISDNLGDPVANGNYSMTFSIFDASIGGTLKWSETQPSVSITNGIFSALLGSVNPIPDTVFSSDEAYLEITFSGETISPRYRMTSQPYAFNVVSIDGASGGDVSGGITITPTDMATIGNGMTILDTNGNTAMTISINESGLGIIDFYEPVDSKSGSLASTKKMSLRKEGVVMFGTTETDTTLTLDPISGNIQSSGQITLGENSTSSGIWSTVFGYNNTATADSATISGGYLNLANGFNAVIGGGSFNEAGFTSTVSGGVINKATRQASTIGGGNINEINESGFVSVIAGGGQNTISDGWAVIGGGAVNTIDLGGLYGTIAGGSSNQVLDTAGSILGGSVNTAAGRYASVLGGSLNQANGRFSVASGYSAIASHDGSFVWSDTTSTTFFSVIENEFAINAENGLRTLSNNASYTGYFQNNGNGEGLNVYSNTSSGTTFGTIYSQNSGSSPALVAQAGTGLAANFLGDVNITGSIAKGSGSFKIDHPLDPANKYLYHSFVESPDMKNIYDGNATTDADGKAVVTLPDYFEALNGDFRYQLTVIGSFARAIIGEEIINNSFVIRTDEPNVKVSWQVTGIRKDAYAETHRIPTEVMKEPEHRGKYLYPEVFGFGKTYGIGYAEREFNIDYSKQVTIDNPRKNVELQKIDPYQKTK